MAIVSPISSPRLHSPISTLRSHRLIDFQNLFLSPIGSSPSIDPTVCSSSPARHGRIS
ncbi:hypothetical protein RchiOBHm_Chr2g0118921 [Rosa chinensis]|uniref:Uncharacterized protein n=1 Tax=Rosa chinensis TaxID=74649 RepID=A0A2P6RRW8_ROSCH|nr:hypothetical protein RchiOBHm_Chr2g0118921 [Rosa chinensis]